MLDMLIITTSHFLPPPKATLRNGKRGENYEYYMILCTKHSPPLPHSKICRRAYNLNSLSVIKRQGKLNEGEYIYKIVLRSP